MRKLVLKMSMSLDGLVAGPKGENDWVFRTADDASNAWGMELVRRAGLHGMGSHTYGEMAGFWPWANDAFAEPMNRIPKVVFSHRSLDAIARDTDARPQSVKDAQAKVKKEAKTQPTEAALEGWRRPRVMSGTLDADVRQLKSEPGGDVVVYGGAGLAQSLVERDLIDELYLLTHPVVLGRGMPLFSKLERARDLELVYAKPFPGGTVGQLYRPKRSAR